MWINVPTHFVHFDEMFMESENSQFFRSRSKVERGRINVVCMAEVWKTSIRKKTLCSFYLVPGKVENVPTHK